MKLKQIRENQMIAKLFQKIGKVSLPFCDVCNKRVVKLYAKATATAFGDSASLFVECHNDKQMVLHVKDHELPIVQATFGEGWRAFPETGYCRENGMLVPGERPEYKDGKLVNFENNMQFDKQKLHWIKEFHNKQRGSR